MTEIGYTLSTEEHGPADLVRYARTAEEAGFAFALISDHFHPWIARQGDLCMLPDETPPIMVAAAGERAIELACGPDPETHLEAIRAYIDAGFDHVYVHQVGPDQEGFFRFYEDEVLPKA